MSWVLRVTNIVPFSNRASYDEFMKAAFKLKSSTVGGYPDEKDKKLKAEAMVGKFDQTHIEQLQKKLTDADTVKVEHIGSYRVVLGNVMEYMHLIRLKNLDVLNQQMDVCSILIKMYDFEGNDLVTESRYEILKEVERNP